MRTSVTPTSLLVHQTDEFLRLLPSVRDGGVDAIHDARVATRRIRELLPLTAAHFSPSDAQHLEHVVSKATARLGRVRDADVILGLLQSLESALPDASAEAAALRRRWTRQREKNIKRAIKGLESLKVAQVLGDAVQALAGGTPLLVAIRRHGSAAVRWEDALAAQLRERSGNLAVALEHAGGVLFPRRLHGVRIAMKKLRYAIEIAIETGEADVQRVLPSLKKAQELLGRLHDHDVLAAALRSEGATRLLPLVDHQMRRLHERYIARRAALVEVCAVAARAAARQHRAIATRRTALVASVPLVMLALPLVRRRAAS